MLTKRKKEKKMITDNTKAYVYKITVNSTNKKYIGFHKLKEGEVVSNYIHSSEDAIFQEDFAKGDNTYEIIAEGNATDMATLERDMLLEVDAKNNEEYYNKSNGGGMYVKSVGKKLEIMEVYQLIKNKELKIDLIKKAVIIALARYQTRVENTDMKHVQTLADTMIDLHGNINDFDPIIVLRGDGKNGKDIILDGNHTTLAAKQVSYVVNVPTMYIEKEIWSQFDEVQLVILANLLNPQQEKAAKSGSIDDQVSWIVKSFKKNGVLADSQENIDILKSMNFKTRSINSIIKKAKTKITLNDKLPDGWIWKVWKLYQTELDTIIENASDRDSVAYATSSGKFNFEVALDKLEALMTMKSKKRYMTIFVTHPTWAHMQEFQTKWLPIYKKKIETWIAPKGFNVEIKELDYKIKSSLEDM